MLELGFRQTKRTLLEQQEIPKRVILKSRFMTATPENTIHGWSVMGTFCELLRGLPLVLIALANITMAVTIRERESNIMMIAKPRMYIREFVRKIRTDFLRFAVAVSPSPPAFW